jgi:hypothetical protein
VDNLAQKRSHYRMSCPLPRLLFLLPNPACPLSRRQRRLKRLSLPLRKRQLPVFPKRRTALHAVVAAAAVAIAGKREPRANLRSRLHIPPKLPFASRLLLPWTKLPSRASAE